MFGVGLVWLKRAADARRICGFQRLRVAPFSSSIQGCDLFEAVLLGDVLDVLILVLVAKIRAEVRF